MLRTTAGGGGQAVSLTFGDRAENHAGMQMIGEEAACGFTAHDLEAAAKWWSCHGCTTELVALHRGVPEADEAYVLVVRGGVAALLAKNGEEGAGGKREEDNSKAEGGGPDELLAEQLKLDVDKKAYMKGRVVNKRARYNLCYGETAQEPDYGAKCGRIVAFRDVPLLRALRKRLPEALGAKAKGLVCELNLYYDTARCGIGFHGDTERRIVICARLGEPIPLQYRWFCRSTPVGEPITVSLRHGDVYVMSDKAVGYDWKRSSKLTLRHAAGAPKYFAVKRTPVPASHAAALLQGKGRAQRRPATKAKKRQRPGVGQGRCVKRSRHSAAAAS